MVKSELLGMMRSVWWVSRWCTVQGASLKVLLIQSWLRKNSSAFSIWVHLVN